MSPTTRGSARRRRCGYADACNFFDLPDGGATARRKLALLPRACEAEGRPFERIDKTISTRLGRGEAPADLVERGRVLAGLGFQHLVLITPGPWCADVVAGLAGAVGELSGV